MTLHGRLIVHSADTFSEHCCHIQEHFYPININGNIFYEDFWNIANLEDAILLCRFVYRES